ncbi:3-methylcrotonyl-CoA carboxylase subunit alpha, partial [Aureobasidium melanogenum]
EIACRIISTCRALGVTSIAIYVDEDRNSLHVRQADEAISIGSITNSKINPHVDIGVLLETALRVKADAIHPGYGYLSENAEFARGVKESGLIWIGPGHDAIDKLGDKRQAKDYLAQHRPEIPLIPGYSGKEQSVEALQKEAEAIGYPVLIKAAAGGGGKGMRVVHDSNSFAAQLEAAQSEGLRSFGSSDCLLEKYIERGKHVEIQMLGDAHGSVLTLFDRECSIQRRHQKIIEEAPCPWLTPELRASMSETARILGELLKYESAGTVEFMVDISTCKYYFLEVNTRIQVEHAITEEITGVDVVALQIFVASGGDLTKLDALKNLQINGHAIECRLCAEDPHNNFLPGSGTIVNWSHNSNRDGITRVRIETAVESGSQISVHFDPMIAKIVVWAPSRQLARAKMLKVMANLRCVGLTSNQLFLQSCLAHSAFQDVAYSTGFIGSNLQELLKNPYVADIGTMERRLAVVPSLLRSLSEGHNASRHFRSISQGFRNQKFGVLPAHIDIVSQPKKLEAVLVRWLAKPRSLEKGGKATFISHALSSESTSMPTSAQTAFKNILDSIRSTSGSEEEVLIEPFDSHLKVQVNGVTWHNYSVKLDLNHERIQLYLSASSETIYCHSPILGTFLEYQSHSLLEYCETLREVLDPETNIHSKIYKSQMPCKVIRVAKKTGDQVKSGEVMLVVESMKMELSINASADGTFEPHVSVGDAVDADVILCEIN